MDNFFLSLYYERVVKSNNNLMKAIQELVEKSDSEDSLYCLANRLLDNFQTCCFECRYIAYQIVNDIRSLDREMGKDEVWDIISRNLYGKIRNGLDIPLQTFSFLLNRLFLGIDKTFVRKIIEI